MRNTTRKGTITVLPITHNNTAEDLEWFYKSEENKEKIRPLEDLVPVWRNKYIITVFELLPIPPNTPPKYLFVTALITAMPRNALSRSPLSVWEYKFELV